jgi:hypothetical protein
MFHAQVGDKLFRQLAGREVGDEAPTADSVTIKIFF